jgi:hypothetical protein
MEDDVSRIARATAGEAGGMAHTNGPATDFDRARTPAQWYCLIAGLALTVAGIAGFFVDSGFDVGNNVSGGSLLGFEVNGIHNLIHLLTGLLLIFSSRTRASARAVAIAFGVTYGIVAIIGLIDGSDVIGLIPINGADNVLHVLLALLGIVAGLVSRSDDRARSGTVVDRATNPRFQAERDRERTTG